MNIYRYFTLKNFICKETLGFCQDLDKLAASAVEQMKDKKYDVNLDTPVYYIGLSHCGKQAAVYYQKS